jgi:hypothetical protein
MTSAEDVIAAATTRPGCAHWGQVEPSAQLKAVPIGVQPAPPAAGPEPG